MQNSANPKMPSRAQMMLPLLETIQEMGGKAKPQDVIQILSDRFEIPENVREEAVVYSWEKWGSRTRNPWRQTIHWVRQEAATRGFIDRNQRGIWTLTEKAQNTLCECQPGTILIVYETPNGQALWVDAVTAAGAIRDESIDLIYQSPPYPIINGRSYGTFTDWEIVELLMKCAPDWKRGLTETGSLVLNLKDCWLPANISGGNPVRSIYIDKLVCAMVEEAKMNLADRHFWRNPACAPTSPWVTIQKRRAACDLEHVLWFSKTGNPHADTRNVMQAAKPATVATYLAKARRQQANKVCESGHNNVFEEQLEKALRGEEIKVLPRTVQEFANSAPQTALKKLLQEAGLPPHPARMPLELAKFWVKFLTKPGHTVADFFAGSGTTGLACEQLGRTWISGERSLAYVLGSALRHPGAQTRFEPEMAVG